MKYLLWALLIYLAWRWYETKKAKESGDGAPAADTAADAGSGTPEKMVACAECGIHLPLSEAVRGGGALHYCSDAHRDRHAAG
jgi:uncharacterized protein